MAPPDAGTGPRARRGAVLLACGLLLVAPRPGRADPRARTPLLTTEHFAVFSDFDTNLNDALIAAGLARRGGKPELFHSGDETACFAALPAPVRAGWEKAVDYYAEIVSPADWTENPQHLIRVQLAGFDDELQSAEDRRYVDIVASVRGAAAPAYRACRWTVQDGKNRAWIDALKPRLAADERRVAARLERLYGTRWDGLPIPVDVVETVNWSGANSILRDPAGGHLLISNSYQGPSALEVVFHESSHLLMRRDAPVQRALSDAASAVGFHLPGDLWHVVLFYTTGVAVRGILDDDGQRGYTPMLYGIFERGSWAGYRPALEEAWGPYVAGERSLPEAAAALIAALRKPQQSPGAPAKPSGAMPPKPAAPERP